MTRAWNPDIWCELTPVDSLPPFLMALTSPSDHWGFVSSRGGLTLGRVDAERCLFPYETDDRLHRAHHSVGPQTILRVQREGERAVTEVTPWRDPSATRRLYKHRYGHQLVFEATLPNLGLTFTYRWAPSTTLGWVRSCWLDRHADAPPCRVSLIDGVLGLMPPGVSLGLYQGASCLVDAYRRAELVGDTSLALLTMESQITDRPEPKESLYANTAWTAPGAGLEDVSWALNPCHLDTPGAPADASLWLGRPAAYLMHASVTLGEALSSASWHQVYEVRADHGEVARTLSVCQSPEAEADIVASLEATTATLNGFVKALDGVQQSADAPTAVRHAMSALFNGMRGGLPLFGAAFPARDFFKYVASRAPHKADRVADLLTGRAPKLTRSEAMDLLATTKDPALERLALEYLPLGWGRRHGGPSRPWNRFSIQLQDDAGAPRLHYEGNWRDIFQNWEALAWSYPDYADAMLARFVGASSADGFNPYRISRDGVDWEVPDPEDPWAHIGYWGDHQGPYLARLVSLCRAAWPDRFTALLTTPRFGYVDIPYRLAGHEAMLASPKQTIHFDFERHAEIDAAVTRHGEDARLLPGADGTPWTVTLLEKLLVAAMARLGQLVVGGGVWMSTQRPEWNDANNALAGEGLSVVSTCYLRRSLSELRDVLVGLEAHDVTLSESVATWLNETRDAYAHISEQLSGGDPLSDADRRNYLDRVALPYERHRERAYNRQLGGAVVVPKSGALALCDAAIRVCEWTLKVARRHDGLYDGYRLMARHSDGSLGVTTLPVMLEGQVAILSSGLLSGDDAVALLDTLFTSGLYRPDQQSFTLMVPRARPSFLDVNTVNVSALSAATLKRATAWNTLRQDTSGIWRFHPELTSHKALSDSLEERQASEDEHAALSAAYEATFEHQRFLGRSGTMYSYEGIGCIYWHMVAKLLLAVGESALNAPSGAPARERLVALYQRVRDGLGFRRTAESYGAFPTDPYSHTPAHRGAQQPGMTGLVKEDLLTRYLELGISLDEGRITFAPLLLSRSEFIPEPGVFEGHPRPADAMAFTLAGVPVIYTLGDAPRVEVVSQDGERRITEGARLDLPTSLRWLLRENSPRVAYITIDRGALS